jgi:hypothetical protein
MHSFANSQPNHPLTQMFAPHLPPLFTSEGPQFYHQAYRHNAPFAVPGPYQTKLSPKEESAFRQWTKEKMIPFDPDAVIQDYDMRGFWKEQPKEAKAWRHGHHFPDTYKTPYDTTFSAESKYAKKGTPFVWQGDNLIDKRTGRLIFGKIPMPTL